ncbi:MAG: succinylglutamate desuccinylase/aspartoacylase family protein [Proteobacteria bacterium]|nr:succinylglutamate desuccinylase/aspartoacylase family protein [Pseudomonadota bacterium]
MTLKVGTVAVEAGERRSGELVLGHYPDGPVTSPVTVARGARPGKTLWVQACIHGPEIGGTIGLIRFLERLDLAQVSGAVVAVMLANPMAFRGYARNTPIDGVNLNRAFPGDAKGYHSQQTAGILLKTALAVADAVVDLHSGGDSHEVPFYALYRADGSPASEEAARLARAAGTPDIWASSDKWLDGAMLTHATKRGKPAVIIECGGGGPLLESQIENFVTALTGMAQALGIVPGEAPRQPRYRVMGEALLVFSRRGGFFVPSVKIGEVVAKGARLGVVMDFSGKTVEEPRSPNGPAYIAALPQRYFPVYSGTMIAETIQVVGEG